MIRGPGLYAWQYVLLWSTLVESDIKTEDVGVMLRTRMFVQC